MINLLIFILFLPAILGWLAFKLAQDMGRFFGMWLVPAVLAFYLGVTLLVTGPAPPDATFESVFQWLSGVSVLGLRAPVWMLILSAALFVVGAARRHRRPSWKTAAF